ncbi:hypothetical protein MUB24_18135 [Lederbergia sp. NSJ-179]|uniref:hypothetical protein n=1 Tax=Lederbergia sp. NSJ-179 TaxID=2931402 RepID=UPI001FD479CA|nr:hypothetical protein [Lederbergia sp. NSJ-179]MCJ7842762.1 hypothetical protein [Lederbergia sp. NSJ-179]
MNYRQQMPMPFPGQMTPQFQGEVPQFQGEAPQSFQGEMFPQQLFPGWPDQSRLERRVNRLENQVQRLERQFNRLDRRVSRLEGQRGYPEYPSQPGYEEVGYY